MGVGDNAHALTLAGACAGGEGFDGGKADFGLEFEDRQVVGDMYSLAACNAAGEKRLMAIRAARLEAMRDLTEQVHGLRLDSTSTVNDMVLRSDYIRGLVDGEIRGARTTSIKPKSADTFEVVLTLDPDVVRYIVKAAKTGN